MPAGALRLAGLADLRRRVALDHWHKFSVGLQIGDPAAAKADKPQVSLSIERAPLQELALRRIVNVGEFLDRADPCRQRRQPQGCTGPALVGWAGACAGAGPAMPIIKITNARVRMRVRMA